MTHLPLEITLRDMPHSKAIEENIRKKADKLTHYCNKVESCKVVVGVPQKHKHQGKLFATNIEVKVPGKTLVVTHKLNEDIYVGIRDAFAAMNRQVESYAQRKRGYVKAHLETVPGRVVKLYDDFGFIEDFKGNEFYFNAVNVLNPAFTELKVGDIVAFLEGAAGESIQATHISVSVDHLH